MGYTLRLIYLCFASFFLLHLALGVAVASISSFAVRRTGTMRPRQVVWLLLLLRLSPAVVSVSIVLFICVPSYLRYELNGTTETVGLLCELWATLGLSLWFLAAVRTARALISTSCFSRGCSRCTRLSDVVAGKIPVYVINRREDARPGLALVGIFRPKLLLSPRVVETLTREQLQAALAHEAAHYRASDNVKRLFLSFLPDMLPFVRSFRYLDANLTNVIELAADDEAVAGQESRSVALAEAILRVARLHCGNVSLPMASLLTPVNETLASRIERLLSPACERRSSSKFVPLAPICFAALLTLPGLIGAMHPMYEMLERLLR